MRCTLIKSLINFRRVISGQQRGQILILTLILLMLSSLMVIPLVTYINSGIKSTQTFQRDNREIYAADTGIQYAMWKIKNDAVIIADRNNNHFGQTYSYTPPSVNNNNLAVSISYVWLLSEVIDLTNGSFPHDTWLGMNISGIANPAIYDSPPNTHSVYTINFTYSGSGNKKIDQIGIWLPHGFSYVAGSCSRTNFPNNLSANDPTMINVYGGTNLYWDIQPNFSFQNVNPPVASQRFWYTPAGTTPKGAAAWNKAQSNDIGYAWDSAVWWYNVTSTAVDNTVSPPRTTVIQAIVVSDPGTSSGLNMVTYVITP